MSETHGGDAFAVVGTDTSVGKTVVTAGLVAWLREEGIDARAVKPVQTGYPPDDDAGFVAEACRAGDAATCIERLEPPLAPRVAAERVGTELSYVTIREGCERALAASEVGVLEGVGGVRVPLAGDREVIDLVADLELPAVVVARSGLGTLNHTALTVEGLAAHGVETHAVVLNEYTSETVAERTNQAELERMTDVPVHTLSSFDLTTPEDVASGVRDGLPADVFPVTR
ncbi:dethiobiotin synthase [Halococcus agarilyticus]|uniref:dethiobiotin synthase n=1 Tax=Halococcus agarilyticus TaxID=1232219 RepID=UPI00067779ED|nr:dethiobiotin synthase [Halococcus agarilyticus]